MKQTRIQIKPTDLGLNDFISAQASVKPAVQYKGECWVLRVSDDPLAFLSLQPVLTSSGSTVWDVKFIMQPNPGEFVTFQPTYECLDCPGVSLETVGGRPFPLE
jgi:hypothetical protein